MQVEVMQCTYKYRVPQYKYTYLLSLCIKHAKDQINSVKLWGVISKYLGINLIPQ